MVFKHVAHSDTVSDTVTFFRNLRRRPRNTGAILPSGPILGKAIAGQIDTSLEGPILEMGPGTGVFTKALLERGIAPERLILVEFNADFVRHLRKRFPGVTVIHGSAFDLSEILAERGISKVAGIVSGLPLLNFPEELGLSFIRQCMDALTEGGVLAQFTYHQRAPIAAPEGVHVSLAKRVWLNMPPATVWIYEPAHELAELVA